jgi:hypothetical protein
MIEQRWGKKGLQLQCTYAKFYGSSRLSSSTLILFGSCGEESAIVRLRLFGSLSNALSNEGRLTMHLVCKSEG